jgi:hypothetical protein
MSFQNALKPGWKHPGLWLLFAGLIALAGCKKDKPAQEIKQVEQQNVAETELQQSRQAGDLLSLQEQIREAPASVELRQQLLALAVNAEKGTIRAVGYGKIPENPANRPAVQQSAERAAFVDGCRWLAYLRAWNKDVTRPDFGRIQGELPSARTVYKHSAVDQEVIMVETELQ